MISAKIDTTMLKGIEKSPVQHSPYVFLKNKERLWKNF